MDRDALPRRDDVGVAAVRDLASVTEMVDDGGERDADVDGLKAAVIVMGRVSEAVPAVSLSVAEARLSDSVSLEEMTNELETVTADVFVETGLQSERLKSSAAFNADDERNDEGAWTSLLA